MLRSVQDSNDVDLISLDAVDETVRSVYHFTNLREAGLRNDSARKREIANLLRASRQAVDSLLGVKIGSPGDIGVYGSQVISRSVRPVDYH